MEEIEIYILKNVSVVETLFSWEVFFQKYLYLMVSFKDIKVIFVKDFYYPFKLTFKRKAQHFLDFVMKLHKQIKPNLDH